MDGFVFTSYSSAHKFHLAILSSCEKLVLENVFAAVKLNIPLYHRSFYGCVTVSQLNLLLFN